MYSIVVRRASTLYTLNIAHESLFYQFSETYAFIKLSFISDMLLSEYCYLTDDSIEQMIVNVTQKHYYQI